MKKKQEFFSNPKKGNSNHDVEWVYSNNRIISGFPDLSGNLASLSNRNLASLSNRRIPMSYWGLRIPMS